MSYTTGYDLWPGGPNVENMTLGPLTQRCGTCGQQWWDTHCCPKQNPWMNLDGFLPTVEPGDVVHASAHFNWGWKGCGFGQLSFEFDHKTCIISCSNEYMSRESVRKILRALADHIADVAVMECDREAEADRARAE